MALTPNKCAKLYTKLIKEFRLLERPERFVELGPGIKQPHDIRHRKLAFDRRSEPYARRDRVVFRFSGDRVFEIKCLLARIEGDLFGDILEQTRYVDRNRPFRLLAFVGGTDD